MPNRDLKESNRRSPSLQLLSDAAERLWYRLITAVDDFGRLEADPEVVFTTCFQRVPKGWTIAKVSQCLCELASKSHETDAPLIVVYEVGGRRYLQIVSTKRYIHQRAKQSKYPSYENQQVMTECEQMQADASGCEQMSLRVPYPVSRIPNPESRIPYPEEELRNSSFSEDEPTDATAQARGSVDSFVLTPELEAWSAKEGIFNPGQYLPEFVDHWKTSGGKRKNGQAVKDWAAAFRNRLRYLQEKGLLKPAPRMLPQPRDTPTVEYVPPPAEVLEKLARLGKKRGL